MLYNNTMVGLKVPWLKNSYDDVISADEFWTSGIQQLQQQSKRCVNHKEDYVEK